MCKFTKNIPLLSLLQSSCLAAQMFAPCEGVPAITSHSSSWTTPDHKPQRLVQIQWIVFQSLLLTPSSNFPTVISLLPSSFKQV